MSHFAKVEEGIVTQVIVAEQDFIDTQAGQWIQTSYNAKFRKNYAGIGMIWDPVRDAFYAQQPSPKFTFNEEKIVNRNI